MDTTELIWAFERLNSFGAFQQTLKAIRNNRLFTAAQLARVEKAWVVNSSQGSRLWHETNGKSLSPTFVRDVDFVIAALDARARLPLTEQV